MLDTNDHIILKDYSTFDGANKIVGKDSDKRFQNARIEMVQNTLKKKKYPREMSDGLMNNLLKH